MDELLVGDGFGFAAVDPLDGHITGGLGTEYNKTPVVTGSGVVAYIELSRMFVNALVVSDAATGDPLWRSSPGGEGYMSTFSLTVSDGRIFVASGSRL